MKNGNMPGGTLRITLANTIQYVIMALFYMIVTKTNILTQTDIGTISLLNFLAATFTVVTLFALPTALTKFTSEKIGKNQKEEAAAIQKTIIKTVVILSIIGLVIAAFLSQLITQLLWNNPDYMIALILAFTYSALGNIQKLFSSTFQALYLFGEMAIITVTFVISSRIIAILLAFLKMGVTGVMVGYVIGIIISLTVAIIFLKGKLPKTKKSMPLRPIISYSVPLFLSSITALILHWADIVIINSITGDLSLTGIYSIAINSAGTLSLLYVPIMTTIFPSISVHHGLEKTKNIKTILKTASRIILFLLIPSCIGLAIVAPTALTLFYGSSYAKGAVPLAILSIGTIITALFTLYTTTFGAIGKTGQVLKIKIIATIVTILTLLSLVPLLDTTGAAIGRLITNIVALALAIYILNKEIKISLDTVALWKSAASTIAFIPFLLVIELILSTKLSIVQTLAIELLTAAAIYAFMLYVLKALKRDDFQLLRQALPKPLIKYVNIIEKIIVRQKNNTNIKTKYSN